ncbi:MAG: L,D-transpeptidase family protein [Terrimicrobiaceae bacterium]|nr:L,D-transpeptidase family protein [Terrimicrobiaceae bacterium]
MNAVRDSLRFAPLLALGLALAACETTKHSTAGRRAPSRNYSEATQFLGANGQVVTIQSTRAKARAAEAAAYWHGDGVSGAAAITIDIGAQKALFYKGGRLVGETPISSGNAQHPTPHGSFCVIQKDRNHRSTLYGNYVDASGNTLVANVDVTRDREPAGGHFLGAPMPYFLRFHDGAGMHAGFLPGFPDSHGCVRLPDHMAEIFFQNASNGTPVRVVD